MYIPVETKESCLVIIKAFALFFRAAPVTRGSREWRWW